MRALQAFRRDVAGSAAIVFAVASVPMTAVVAGAVDFSKAYAVQMKLQAEADAAALRVSNMGALATGAQRLSAAQAMFTDASAGSPAVTVAWDGQTTTVTASLDVRTSMLGIAGIATIPARVKSSAKPTRSGPSSCVLALNGSASGAITISGSSTLAADGCALYSNSASPSAISIQGGAVVSAAGFCAVGGVAGGTGLTPAPLTGCFPVSDPFAALPAASGSGCAYNNMQVQPNQNKALGPGVYCGGLTIKGTVTLSPGVYIIKDGPLTLNSQGSVSGSGVTFYMTGSNAGFTLNAGGTITLSAPTSGTYSGMLLVQDKASNVGAGNTLNGGANMTLTGAIYTPTQTLTLNGGSSFGQSSAFMPIIADQIKFAGSTTTRVDTSKMQPSQPLATLQNGSKLVQ